MAWFGLKWGYAYRLLPGLVADLLSIIFKSKRALSRGCGA